MLSIITVVFNDKEAFSKTLISVIEQKLYYTNFEYIVIDGGSTDGTLEIIQENSEIITKYISEKDSGIYDAMNKGIKLASGDALLFLNAGDYFAGNVLGCYCSAPVFLPVMFNDIFRNYKQVKIKNIRKSIPTCHQGIIFENKGILYDISFKICSDYKYFLTMYKKTQIPLLKADGYIHFDSTGISSTAINKRNSEMYLLRKLFFGLHTAFIYSLSDNFRLLLRKIIQWFSMKTK